MSKPKIDRGVDWRELRDKVSGNELERKRKQIIGGVKSFRDLRLKLGFTQVEVAEMLNMTQSNVSKIESRSVPDLEALKSLVGDRGRVRVIIDLDKGEEIEMAVD